MTQPHPTEPWSSRPTAAYIDLHALASNFRSVRSFVGPGVGCMAVVKADAYGHGAAPCALRLEAEGMDWFGVAIPEEGADLRRAGITRPILCMGSFWPGQEGLLFEYDLTPVVFDEEIAASLNSYAAAKGVSIDVHVKVDTGMGRVGISYMEAASFAATLASLTNLTVTGLLTHFAAADDPHENDFTRLQIERFEAACTSFRAAGHEPKWLDMANSPGAVAHPASRSNLVRLGGALYGLLDDILPKSTPQPVLRPVLSLSSRIAHVRRFPAGESFGYGRTYFTDRESLIALLPIGYADGYPRGLSNCGRASINGFSVPVIGRISMDWTLLDVTDIPEVHVGSEAFLIGGDAPATIAACELAGHIDTIGYEITCGISPRVPRIYRHA